MHYHKIIYDTLHQAVCSNNCHFTWPNCLVQSMHINHAFYIHTTTYSTNNSFLIQYIAIQYYALRLYTLNMALAYILILYMSFQLHNLVWKHVGKELSNNLNERIVLVALNDSIFLRTLMLEYILFSNNYCKHSKTVIKIKFANVKVLNKHCS